MRLLALIGGGNTKPDPDHSRLDAAKAAAADARQVIADRRETLARLQGVDDNANRLARAAADATLSANQARARWVSDGCLAHAREHHAATEAATKAASEAQLAALDAKAARQAMPTAEADVQRAESDLKSCVAEIDNQIGLAQLEQFKATLEDFRRVSAERHALHVELRGFLEGSLSGDASRQVEQVLNECRVKSISDFACSPQGSHVSSPPREVIELAARWREEAAQLRADPEC